MDIQETTSTASAVFHDHETGVAVPGLPTPRPCPFCESTSIGSGGIVADHGENDDGPCLIYSVRCDQCGILGPGAYSAAEAAVLWNGRACGRRLATAQAVGAIVSEPVYAAYLYPTEALPELVRAMDLIFQAHEVLARLSEEGKIVGGDPAQSAMCPLEDALGYLKPGAEEPDDDEPVTGRIKGHLQLIVDNAPPEAP